MSAAVIRAGVVAIGALLAGAAPAAAQSCLESPLPPAGWAAHVRLLYAPATDVEFEDEVVSPAASGSEFSVARDFRGATALALSATSTDYDASVVAYDPDTGNYETRTIEVANAHLSGRLAFHLLGRLPLCPFVELGWFRAQADGGTEIDVTGDFAGYYAGAGWTYQPRWVLQASAPGEGPGIEASAFATGRLIFIAGKGVDEYDGSSNTELLPKFGFRVGGSVSVSWFFVGADAGIVFPAADPDFWLRHNTADERAAPTIALRFGVLF